MINYLYQLLLEQDCVVLPGFGGFITQYKPAELNFRTNQISPPGKKIAFNPSLNKNDGFLVAFIAQKEHLSYKLAEKKLNSYVKTCEKNLKLNGSIWFEGIGKVFLDENKLYKFIPANNLIQSNSFGFSEVHFTPINRIKGALIESLDQKLNDPVESEYDKIRAKRKMSIWPPRITASIAAFFLIFILISKLTHKDNSTIQTANLIDFNSLIAKPKAGKVIENRPNTNVPIVEKAEDLTLKEEKIEPVMSIEKPIITKEVLNPEKIIDENKLGILETKSLETKVPASLGENSNILMNPSKVTTENDVEGQVKIEEEKPKTLTDINGKLILVVGSFTSRLRAEDYQMKLNASGYNPYIMVNGINFRVCIPVDKENMKGQIAKIKSDVNSKAWLLE